MKHIIIRCLEISVKIFPLYSQDFHSFFWFCILKWIKKKKEKMFFKFKYCYMTTILIFLPANLELSLKNKSSDYYFFLKELSLKRGKRALLKLKLWFYLNLLPRFLIVFFFFSHLSAWMQYIILGMFFRS